MVKILQMQINGIGLVLRSKEAKIRRLTFHKFQGSEAVNRDSCPRTNGLGIDNVVARSRGRNGSIDHLAPVRLNLTYIV